MQRPTLTFACIIALSACTNPKILPTPYIPPNEPPPSALVQQPTYPLPAKTRPPLEAPLSRQRMHQLRLLSDRYCAQYYILAQEHLKLPQEKRRAQRPLLDQTLNTLNQDYATLRDYINNHDTNNTPHNELERRINTFGSDPNITKRPGFTYDLIDTYAALDTDWANNQHTPKEIHAVKEEGNTRTHLFLLGLALSAASALAQRKQRPT